MYPGKCKGLGGGKGCNGGKGGFTYVLAGFCDSVKWNLSGRLPVA